MTATALPHGAQKPRPQSHRALFLVLALGLAHGLIYLAVFPPWQHYDEPSHLEYAVLIARRGRLPQPGDYDLALRREIASSMLAHDFYRDLERPVIDFGSEVPPSIGVDELVHPPLYYVLLAIAIRPFVHQGIEVQLYVARLCSVGLYLVVLLAAYGIATEVWPRRRWLALAAATFLALLPPFTDRMSSVNSDAGAAAAGSLLLWAGVVLAQRGASPRRVGVFAVTVGLCLATKSTAGIVALASAAALAVSFVPRRRRRWLWLGMGVLSLTLLAVLLAQGGRAAHWYSGGPGGAANRVKVGTPLDGSALRLAPADGSGPRAVFQELGRQEGRALRGHRVTVGGWVRAAEGAEGNVLFSLEDGISSQPQAARATQSWQLFALAATVGEEARGVALQVSLTDSPAAAREVYLDGLFLVDSALSPSEVRLADAAATRVIAGDQEMPNLLRNGSAQRSWPGLPSRLGNLAVGRTTLADVLTSVCDFRRTAWVLEREAVVLFRSFWGGFGWNQIQLPDASFYGLLAVTGCGLAGAALALVRRLRLDRQGTPVRYRAWLLLGTALLAGWGMVWLRIYPVFVTARIWWPVARYADVVIIATALLLCAGLAELVPARHRRVAALVGILGLLALDALALGRAIVPYYYG